MSWSSQNCCEPTVDGSFIENFPYGIVGFVRKRDAKCSDHHTSNDVDKPMYSEINNGKGRQNDVA